MTWTHVQGASGHTITSNLSVVLPSNATAGNLIVCTLCQYNTALDTITIHDTVGPLFTFVGGYSNPGGDNIDLEVWYYIQPATRALTVQATPVSFIAMAVDEYATGNQAVTLGTTQVNHGSGTVGSLSAWNAGAGNLAVAAFGSTANGSTLAGAAPYTIAANIPPVASQQLGNLTQYRLSATASEAPSATQTISGGWAMVGASFALPASAGGPISVLISDGCVPAPLRRVRFPRHVRL